MSPQIPVNYEKSSPNSGLVPEPKPSETRIGNEWFWIISLEKLFNNSMQKILYIDMDNVLVNFESGIAQIDNKTVRDFDGRLDEVPGIFALMQPVEGAVESFAMLAQYFDTYVLSTSPWENPSAWSDKLQWVKRHLGAHAYKRLILTHHKNLNIGDYLIDDRLARGADRFVGEFIHFRSQQFPNWAAVVRYLLPKGTR
jgi:5'(3')-deoxyribonucleotidase